MNLNILMNRRLRILLLLTLLPLSSVLAQRHFSVTSPNGRLQVYIRLSSELTFTVTYDTRTLVDHSPIALRWDHGTFGKGLHYQGYKIREVDESIEAPNHTQSLIRDNFRECTINFGDGFDLIFRAYDQGVAYRIVNRHADPIHILDETVEYRFGKDVQALVPYVNKPEGTSLEDQLWNSFENTYSSISLADYDTKRLSFLPIMVTTADSIRLVITEAGLHHYPGMHMVGAPDRPILKGVFARYPKTVEQGGHNMLQGVVKEREGYLTHLEGPCALPWRILAVADSDEKLLTNELVYLLSEPSRVKDLSWIKPGKVAWEWWNALNIGGVDFRSGVNNATYRHYIDFAAEQGIEYVILDEGWAVNKAADLFQVVPEIDLPSLVKYGEEKGVGLILWAGYYAFDRDLEKVCREYSQMGIKGFKVDFMDRDDAYMTDFHERAAQMAAKYNLLLDFHGTYKPTGLQRTYPNVLSFEGVYGLEQCKWNCDYDAVTYEVTYPFIRGLAGPADYTQGAMRNGTKDTFRAVWSMPMSQGTRCRQLAQYVIFFSPLTMLCDSPTAYRSNPECTRYISKVPTVWDETVVLPSKVGEYICLARRSGKDWYVAAMTNREPRTLTIDLSGLQSLGAEMEIFSDGTNADRLGEDFRHDTLSTPNSRTLTVRMAPGGGFVAHFK